MSRIPKTSAGKSRKQSVGKIRRAAEGIKRTRKRVRRMRRIWHIVDKIIKKL